MSVSIDEAHKLAIELSQLNGHDRRVLFSMERAGNRGRLVCYGKKKVLRARYKRLERLGLCATHPLGKRFFLTPDGYEVVAAIKGHK